MKNLDFNKVRFSIFVLLFLTSNMSIAAETAFSLKANNSRINMKTGEAEFNKNIVINQGNLKIIAATLTQKLDKKKNQEVMELTGNPAKMSFEADNSNSVTNVEAQNIVFYPHLNIVELWGKTRLQTSEKKNQNTRISAEKLSIKFNAEEIETIHAEGKPLQYYSNLGGNKDPITASADGLTLNNSTGDVELYAAIVKQGDGELSAGKIVVDGETGNLSANTGNNQSRPSFSIELDKIKQQEKQP